MPARVPEEARRATRRAASAPAATITTGATITAGVTSTGAKG